MTPPLDRLLNPRTLAVIGASRDPHKYGSWAIQHTVDYGFEGRIFGINRSADSADLDREPAPLLPSLNDVPGEVDCAMITLPQKAVLGAVEQCAEKGVPYVIIPSTGFGESGEDGKRAQEALLSVARASGMRILGPNSFGLQSASGRVNLTPWDIPTGPIAIASQSGSVAIALHEQARVIRSGFSACMGIGNQIDVSFGDALEQFAADDDTTAVALYVEGMPHEHVDRFLAGLDACEKAGKMVAIIKAGQTAASAMVAATHTGSLAGDSRVWRRVVESHGALCFDSPDLMMDALQGAVRVPAVGHNVFVVADGGGDTALAADAVVANGFQLAALSDATVAALAPLVPPAAPRVPGLNPLTADTPGGIEDDPHLLADIIEVVREDPGVDLMVISGVLGGYGYLRERENAAVDDLLDMHHTGSPVAVHSSYALDDQEPVEALKAGGIAVYPSVHRLLTALAPRLETTTPWRSESASHRTPDTTTRQIPFADAARMLSDYGIDVIGSRVVEPGDDVAAAADAVGCPAVLKVADPAIVHKSDAGGVVLDLHTPAEVVAAADGLWQRLPQSPLLIMNMAPPGFEVLVGVTLDPLFGPVVIVGRGGIWTEVENDVALLPTPFTNDDVLAALRTLRCAPMLFGHRGRPALDVACLVDIAVGLGQLAMNEPVVGVDLNPVVLYPDGYSVVDVRVMEDTANNSGKADLRD